jgi:hypothetical protein
MLMTFGFFVAVVRVVAERGWNEGWLVFLLYAFYFNCLGLGKILLRFIWSIKVYMIFNFNLIVILFYLHSLVLISSLLCDIGSEISFMFEIVYFLILSIKWKIIL